MKVKNFGETVINLFIDGKIITINPANECNIEDDIYKTYISIFPALRPVVETKIIEAEEQKIEKPKAKKNGKNKK